MAKQVEPMAVLPTGMNGAWPADSESIDAAMKAYSGWVNEWSRIQEESLEFLRARALRDLEAAASLAACTNATELLDMQMRYASEAVNDFLREGQKIVGLVMQSAAPHNGGEAHARHKAGARKQRRHAAGTQ